MTITLIVIVALLAFFLIWILRQSINVRPWVPAQSASASFDRLPSIFTTPRVGMIVFLAAISSLFALTISAYSGRMQMAEDWAQVPVPPLLWINTLILAVASLAFHLGWRAASQGNSARLRPLLLAAGVLSAGFVLGQFQVWRILHADGYYLAVNPANSFFYFLTALHGAHMIGGLVAWAIAMRRSLKSDHPANAVLTVELCAIYWHYLLAVWLVLFGVILFT